jgi:hypothetical protein
MLPQHRAVAQRGWWLSAVRVRSASIAAPATPVFADIDGDDVMELLAGTLHGGIVYFEKRARGR